MTYYTPSECLETEQVLQAKLKTMGTRGTVLNLLMDSDDDPDYDVFLNAGLFDSERALI